MTAVRNASCYKGYIYTGIWILQKSEVLHRSSSLAQI